MDVEPEEALYTNQYNYVNESRKLPVSIKEVLFLNSHDWKVWQNTFYWRTRQPQVWFEELLKHKGFGFVVLHENKRGIKNVEVQSQ